LYRTPGLLMLSSLLLGAVCLFGLLPSRHEEPPVVVYAAASLRTALEAVLPIFQARCHCRIEIRYGASEAMLNQLRLTTGSQPADVFLPADDSYFQGTSDLIARRFPIAQMRAVLLVQAAQADKFTKFEDLFRSDVKLALAQPELAAIGRLTQVALEKRHRWLDLQKQIFVTPDNVVQSATAVDLGTVDGAIVWNSVAVSFPRCIAREFVELNGIQARIEAGLLKPARNPIRAIQLCQFLSEDPGVAAELVGLGFQLLPGRTP
jgi:molybdate transport system substrate-binding protein